MVNKFILAFIISIFLSSSFAGYSSSGRIGFSSGSRSYSAGRSGYVRSSNSYRNYSRPRNYYSPRTNTIVHNNHYSSSGFGMGLGGGFFSGMLGGYIGGSLANNHNNNVITSSSENIVQGQGMLREANYTYNNRPAIIDFILGIGLFVLTFGLFMLFIKAIFCIKEKYDCHKHW